MVGIFNKQRIAGSNKLGKQDVDIIFDPVLLMPICCPPNPTSKKYRDVLSGRSTLR